MKGVLIVLLAALGVAGWRVCSVLSPAASFAPSTMQSPGNRKAGRFLLADRIETKHSVTYTTDPGLERAMKREDREEKEKENNSWKMLEHMDLYGPLGKRPSSTGQGSSSSQ